MPGEPQEDLLRAALAMEEESLARKAGVESPQTDEGTTADALKEVLAQQRARWQAAGYLWEDGRRRRLLYAAAPEMLRLLEEVLDVMVREDFGTLTLVPKIRAVAAKARGEVENADACA